MKSLKFANEYRNITVKSMNDYIDNCDKYGQEINECYFNMLEEQLAHFDIIKQDLEVLEIIKNKKVDIAWFEECFEVVTLKIYSIEEALESYNNYKEQLKLEEATKLYQWLEENNEKDKV